MGSIQDNIAAKKARESGATASTEVVLGAGALKLSSAATSIEQALQSLTQGASQVLSQLQTQSASLTLQIANDEERVQQLNAEAAEAKRRNKVEVELDYQADQAAAADKWATASGKTIIDTKVYQREQAEAEELQDKFEERVQKEVSTATASQRLAHQYELKAVQADYATKEAGNIAQLASQAQTILTLQQTIADLRADATAVREAEVKRAQAGSIQNLNIGQPTR